MIHHEGLQAKAHRLNRLNTLPVDDLLISRKWLAGIDPEQFGACHEYLLAVRLARHMTKTDVVAASMVNGDPSTGVSLPTVSKIETGAYGEPGFRTMVRLSRGYGISLGSLERFFK